MSEEIIYRGNSFWPKQRLTRIIHHARGASLTRIIHRSRGASLDIRHHSTFASLTNTGSIRSGTKSTVITTTLAIHSLSGELSRLNRLGVILESARFSIVCRGCLFAVYLTLLLGTLTPTVLANELDDFQRARSAYESQDYALATTLFEDLVGGTTSKLNNRALVLESFKYLGASYLFLGRFKDAEKVFERLLRKDPSYALDPLAFPAAVQKTFELVRQRLQWERVQINREKEKKEKLERQREFEGAARKRESLIRLADLAETESVERVNSRWVAMIPFGIGQYQNNHPNAGTFFAVTEGLLLTLHIVSYYIHQDLEGQRPSDDQLGEAQFAEKAFRYTNWVSLAIFGAVLITGIVDAQIRFRPKFTSERRRELPSDIRENLKIEISDSGIGVRF